MYKIVTAERFFWEGIDLNNKVVLEGGTSWGNTTRIIVNKILENNWNTKLISVDIDDSHFNEIEDELRQSYNQLQLMKGDLSNLDFIEDESIDVVICNYTMSSVNQFPLRVLKALKELYRVLKKDGQLLITEEMPLWSIDNTEFCYWSKRSRIIKSISVLKAMPHFNEIYPNDLEESLKIVGFRNIECQQFKEKIDAELATKFLDKKKQTLIKGSNDLDNDNVTKGFVQLTEELVKKFEGTEEFSAPAYIIKAKK
ncbi:class I SAM-dependent methyltransferase [Serpentinicella alkaliphila]|uniref:Methyltransferase family protein n=1 Tax=Serpentinicella alkaliphila TaxID=1734049 RepID=A0A4R2TCT1_9FIRM|nr:class I SAM-dependent methyltransferase [Serpentinicella alkaliphila]QUH25790.1 class I SAM-dependent methyltransferase [Serpentinicella alkaliphila]TCP99791.1 methyltransferase family protein [Serpentinicella alkaliphila]